ncbi:MAG: methylmalonyl Co-A mutase-associated GTPase MeaB [Nitritalea sp.]
MRRNRLSASAYVSGVLAGDRVVLSRAITLIESTLQRDRQLAEEVMQEVLPYSGRSLRVGITGVPGVGKSTFIERFGLQLIEQGYKVAVLAVDPSSQQTGGSILGDKTRMERLSQDKRAYIRPSPSGSTLGGVSARTREAMLLCEAAGFDVILIETVGVGQSEIAVKGMVDFFLLLMLAGAGDELQGIKKGIIEICDALIINKADGENAALARRARRTYANALHLFPPKENGWTPEVSTCSGLSGEGLAAIWDMVLRFERHTRANGTFERQRALQRKTWMREHITYLLHQAFYDNPRVRSQLSAVEADVAAGTVSAIATARTLVECFREAKNGPEKPV